MEDMQLQETAEAGNGDDDIYIVRIDDNGNKLWEKPMAPMKASKATDIKALADGSFI